MKNLLIVIVLAFLNGCSLLPFNDESACSLEGNYGKCINGEQAYEEAISGEELFGNYIGDEGVSDVKPNQKREKEEEGFWSSLNPFSDSEETASIDKVEPEPELHNDKFSHVKDKSYIRMKDSVYNEIKMMVDNPVTPMLRPTKVVSTLVLNYQSNGDKTTMYGHRYVYSILKDSEFILNQYMLKSESSTLGFLEQYSE